MAIHAVAVLLAAGGGCGIDDDNLGPAPVEVQPPAPGGTGGEEPRRPAGATPTPVPEPHDVVLLGTNIDKDMYVWLERQPINELVFYASERAGSINLTEALQRRGVSRAVIRLKLGNGDCFGASGDISITVDGQEKWTARVDKRLTDCGWQLEARVRVDLTAGSVEELFRWMK